MKVIIWDVEATDLYPQGDVIQIAGFVTDMKFNMLYSFNKYCYTNAPMSSKAEAVHGISKEDLLLKSGGKFFEDVYDEMDIEGHRLFEIPNSISITYNHAFDQNMVQKVMRSVNLPEPQFGQKLGAFKRRLTAGKYNLCAMELFQKVLGIGHSLPMSQVAMRTLPPGVTLSDVERLYKRVCIAQGYKKEAESKYHNALFDSFVLMSLLRLNIGLISI